MSAEEGKPQAPLWRAHFATILSTVAAAITGLLGYFFVTLHDQDEKRQQFLLERLTRLESLSIQRDQLQIALQKSELDTRRGNLASASDMSVFVPKLLRGEQNEVEQAAIALAVGGKSNTNAIIATLANATKNQEQLIAGLRVAAVADHRDTCASLCTYAGHFGIEDKATVGNLAKALGDLRCIESRDLLLAWISAYPAGADPNPNITLALQQLKPPKPDRAIAVADRRVSCLGG
jgi:hypothetical protein